MTIILGGGTGLIGRALSGALQTSGHAVRVITRAPRNSTDLTWTSVSSSGLPEDTTAVINLSGRNIGEVNPLFALPGPYKAFVDDLFQSRIDTTKTLARAVQSRKTIKTFITASATGYYRPDLEAKFCENEPFKDCGMITKLVKQWEEAAQLPPDVDVKTFQLRLGVVLAPDSGFVQALYPSHRFGLGGPMGCGRQWISWIHLSDVVRAVEFLLQSDCPVPTGPVNLTSPCAVRQAALAKAFCEALKAPKLPFGPPPTPEFVAKLLMGSDRSTLLLEGQRVLPKKLTDAGFKFQYPKLEDALEEIFKHRPDPVSSE